MKKILFVCHGNICRSPMAEYVMKDLVKKGGTGGPVPDRLGGHQPGGARQSGSTRQLGESWRSTISPAAAMPPGSSATATTRSMTCSLEGQATSAHVSHLRRRVQQDKMHLLMEYAGHPDQEVAAPWYTNDFDTAWRDVLAGCQGLFEN